ncbi:MAG TPA: hypothetical protein VES19_09655 [Candidatus Limnocylindrales bacterium]|nr:hypothetical protein [Candidatus Limnocylindrales bacterium]
MKPTRTSLVIVLAVTLLAVATGAVMATSSVPSASGPQVPAAASPTSAPSSSTAPRATDNLLTGVLDDLVAKGTISEAQKKAILDGVATERTVRKEARKAAREQAKADRQQIRDFLADGVITQAEFDKLPAASPLRTLATLMDDGKITADELKTLGKGWNRVGKGGNGWGMGHGWNKAAPSASPTTGG